MRLFYRLRVKPKVTSGQQSGGDGGG